MAAQEGEVNLLTVYADVHYYFSAPTPRPTAHRFDKASYLYLYGNKAGKGGRIEIANNVRKPEQDAFTGTLETITVRQSYKQPTLCTITVDGFVGHHVPTTSKQLEHQWRLPNTDPRNEGKYLFRLHTLDLYFWTAADADKFINSVESILEPGQVELLRKPGAPAAPAAHENTMSPVVQNLEKVAIQDPAYSNGRAGSISQASTEAPTTAVQSTAAKRPEQETASFQPLAYNPAAPAAPEPIKHREKTPPPEDGDAGTGLVGAAARDHAHAVSPGISQPYSQGYISPMLSVSQNSSYASPPPVGGFSGPPSAVQGQRTSSVSSFPGPPQSHSGHSTATPTFAPPPQAQQSTASPSSLHQTPTFNTPQPPPEQAPFYSANSPPTESPATEILGTSYVASHHQPLQHHQPQYAQYQPQQPQTPVSQQKPAASSKPEPIGGYSSYSYEQQQSNKNNNNNEYNIHSQVYRPTQDEWNKPKPTKSSKHAAGSPAGRLEDGVGKVDKGVNKFFKKLEKKMG